MISASTCLVCIRFTVVTMLLAMAFVCCFPSSGLTEEKPSTAPQAVDNMHHFMEYVFEPNYKRLKASLATEPTDKQAWKAVKGDALTLAEGANLLLLRLPDEDAEDWKLMAVEVRGHGAALFQAARKPDYSAAQQAYKTMLKSCNACHQQFADGKHQLAP